MHRTGQVYNVAPGNFDSSKGEYRKTGVFAVESLVKSLCEDIAKNIHQAERLIDIYNTAFDFHFDLVSIHPFADGNRKKYFIALEESRQAKSKDPIRAFLCKLLQTGNNSGLIALTLILLPYFRIVS